MYNLMRVKSVFFFRNGNTAVFDSDRQQIPALQSSWMLDALEGMRRKGAVIDESAEIVLPNGDLAKLFRTEEGWNWQIKKG